MNPRYLPLSLALILSSLSGAHAASFYLHATNGASNNWNQTSIWFDTISGAGNNPGTIAGHDYFTNGFGLRTAAAAGAFGGATLTLGSSASDAILLKNSAGQTATISDLTSLGGGSIQDFTAAAFGGVGNPPILAVTTFSNLGTTHLDISGNDARAFKLSIGTLSGAGDLSLKNSGGTATGGTVFLSATTTAGYTGNIVWGDANGAILNFDSAFTSGGGLVAGSTSRINLDQNVTFANVTLNGTTLGAGIWDYNYLNTNFDAIFTDGGSGSITVVPEPGNAAFLAAAVLVLGWKRSRRVAH